MERIKEIITSFEKISGDPAAAVKAEMEATGKKAVGCFPYYMPDEIIYAAGMLPVGLWGGQTKIRLADRFLQSFCCSLMRENMELGMNGAYGQLSAVMIPTYCDTLKCVCENWKYAVPDPSLIPVVYPQNRRISAGMEYLVTELNRVQGELEKIAGKKVTESDLLGSIEIYENYREAMRAFTKLVGRYPKTLNAKTRHSVIKAAYFTDKTRHTEKIAELIRELEKLPEEASDGLRVVVTGILAEPDALLDLFDENGLVIAADDLAQESRQFRTSVISGKSALEMLAYRMASQSCSTLYDENKSRGDLLIDLARENNADGVVICMLKFCDPEEFDYPIFKKELEAAKIPALYLEIEQQMDSVEPLRTRIQSFTEMLGNGKG
jgi:bcr-type benzoyl-CoA reductase subunit C